MSATLWTPSELPPVDRREILRYAGVLQTDERIEAVLDSCLQSAQKVLSCRVCYAIFPVTEEGDTTDVGIARLSSKTLQKHLHGCSKTLLFAATLGLEFDRLVTRTALTSPAQAVLLQAVGSERIEALCDAFAEDARENLYPAYHVLPRFSPGYGDLPLSLQKEIFAALQCTKLLGMGLNESLLISPAKSVTAFMGLVKEPENASRA